MIDVNLLPHHLRPIKRTPLPYILSALAFLLVLAGVAWVYLQGQRQIAHTEARLNSLNGELNLLRPIIEESEKLQTQKRMVADKMATITEIVADRIIWSEQLYNLARLAPQNLWYDGFKVETRQFRTTRQVPDPKNKGQFKTEPVMVPRQILVVSGYVVQTPTGGDLVGSFALATQQDEAFSSLFTIVKQSITDTEFEKQPVRKFALEFRIGADEGKEP